MSLPTPLSAGNAGGVERLRAALAAGRAEVRRKHQAGASGSAVSAALTRLCDDIVGGLWRYGLHGLSPDLRERVAGRLVVVAVGGYGRGEMAPCSDVDLLFVPSSDAGPEVAEFISWLVRGLWDVGLRLSHAVRDPAEAVAFARDDFRAQTSLFEMRRLAGDDRLFEILREGVEGLIRSQSVQSVATAARVERLREHEDYRAQTVFLVEPNVKKSPGGIRDLHMFRWLARVRYGMCDWRALQQAGLLSAADSHTMATAADFLRRVRNELHFHSGLAQDVLTREDQIRIAEWMGFRPTPSLLAVEVFMQKYYRLTTELHDLVERFVERLCEQPGAAPTVDPMPEGHPRGGFVFRGGRLGLAGPAGETGGAERMLKLFETARRYRVPVAWEAMEQVRAASAQCVITPDARRMFLEQLAEPEALGTYLRDLRRAGLLGRILPGFENARCLFQFNLFHRYTVDEHTIRAVEAATDRRTDPGPIGRTYREIRRKDLLHLALLLHDLGKGVGPDHCDAGREIAERTADEFALGPHDRRLLCFLVHRHLLMAHTALRRDLTDVNTIVHFARAVETPEALRMLYVMTAADTAAVAPGEWTAWKEALLNELYVRAMQELTGGYSVADAQALADRIRAELEPSLHGRFPSDWLQAQLNAMPPAYLLGTDVRRLAGHLYVLEDLHRRRVRAIPEYQRETQLMQFTVIALPDVGGGAFARIAGVLAAAGFHVVSANIATRSDGIVIDTFSGIDADFSGEPPAGRQRQVAGWIEQVLLGELTVETLFARRGRPLARARPATGAMPPQVGIDDETSDRFTIVEVFAPDRPGLLYAIARTLLEEGLSVHSAKVSTHYEQAVDVFYVTQEQGGKLGPRSLLIRQRLLDVLTA